MLEELHSNEIIAVSTDIYVLVCIYILGKRSESCIGKGDAWAVLLFYLFLLSGKSLGVFNVLFLGEKTIKAKLETTQLVLSFCDCGFLVFFLSLLTLNPPTGRSEPCSGITSDTLEQFQCPAWLTVFCSQIPDLFCLTDNSREIFLSLFDLYSIGEPSSMCSVNMVSVI